MQIVYAPGCWDLLHVGHVNFLERASKFGHLIVGVASDQCIIEDKGKPPIIPLVDRIKMLSSLRCVSMAVPYYRLEFISHLSCYKPNVLAVGVQWGTQERHVNAEKWCEENGAKKLILQYTEGVSTTRIREAASKQ